MFSPTQSNSSLHEQLSKVFSAVHRAAFDADGAEGSRGDPMLAVPVRLLPLVQSARSMRRTLAEEGARRVALEALLDLAGEALLAIDADRRILFANAAARRIVAERGADEVLEQALRGLCARPGDPLPGPTRVLKLHTPPQTPVYLVALAPGINGADGTGS